MTIFIKRYNPDKKNQWNDFVKTSKNGIFLFDRNYMDYHADRFQDHSLMIYDEQEKLISIMPANISNGVLYSHQGLTFGGFIYGSKMRAPVMLEMFKALQIYARESSINKIIYKAIPYFYHKQPAQEDLYALFRLDAKCYRVDISSTIYRASQIYAFSSSRKSGLKKARDNALTVAASNDLGLFFDMLNRVLESKYETKATHSVTEMQLLQSRFPNHIKLYGCFADKEMLAGVVIYESDMVAHTQYIGSSAKGKELGATDLLLDYLINDKYAHKHYFDFGISTEQGGHYLNENLMAQKEGTGARGTINQFFEIITNAS